MIIRILSDMTRSILNAVALAAALGVLFVGGVIVKLTRCKR